MDTIIKVIGYEEARTNFLKSEMEKAQHRIKFWQTKIKKAKNAIAEMEAHDNASNAGWEYNFYKDALEALEAGEDINVLTAQPKWISVEERLPEEGEKVIVCGLKNGIQVGAFRGLIGPMRNCKWWWKKNTVLEVTHWMPLPSMPEPPEEEA